MKCISSIAFGRIPECKHDRFSSCRCCMKCICLGFSSFVLLVFVHHWYTSSWLDRLAPHAVASHQRFQKSSESLPTVWLVRWKRRHANRHHDHLWTLPCHVLPSLVFLWMQRELAKSVTRFYPFLKKAFMKRFYERVL
jgi:hypothetical protein